MFFEKKINIKYSQTISKIKHKNIVTCFFKKTK